MNPDPVASAVKAVAAFGGKVSQEEADSLLLWYRRRDELTEEDRARVVATFKRRGAK